MSTDTPQDIEKKLAQLQKSRKGLAQARRSTLIVGVITILGWLLFVYKMTQTSEAALRYSNAAHEEIGKWVIVLIILSVIWLIGIGMSRIARKAIAKVSGEVKTALRAELETADPGRRAAIESQLRELGA